MRRKTWISSDNWWEFLGIIGMVSGIIGLFERIARKHDGRFFEHICPVRLTGPSSPQMKQMKQDETRWNEMKQDETRWNANVRAQMGPRWNEMKQNETRWNKMKPNETRSTGVDGPRMKQDETRWNNVRAEMGRARSAPGVTCTSEKNWINPIIEIILFAEAIRAREIGIWWLASDSTSRIYCPWKYPR